MDAYEYEQQHAVEDEFNTDYKSPADRAILHQLALNEGLPTAYNSCGGYDTSALQVLRSAAGYYIGTLYYDAEFGQWWPYDRDSYFYYNTREEAEHALLHGYAQRF